MLAHPVIPCALTVLSLVLRVGFLVGGWHPTCAFFGVALDAADGATARRLNVCTRFGAELDWHGDVVAAVLALALLLRADANGRAAPSLLVAATFPALAAMWAHHKVTDRRVSLSAPLVMICGVLRWFEVL